MRQYTMTVEFSSAEPLDLCPVNDGDRGRCRFSKGHQEPHDLVDINEIDYEVEEPEVLARTAVHLSARSLAFAIQGLIQHPDLYGKFEKIISMAEAAEAPNEGEAPDDEGQ